MKNRGIGNEERKVRGMQGKGLGKYRKVMKFKDEEKVVRLWLTFPQKWTINRTINIVNE